MPTDLSASNEGDTVRVKIREQKTVRWVTVVYMGVGGRGNDEDNSKLYRALKTIMDKVGGNRWVVMGDLDGHIGLMEETVNRNGQLMLNFAKEMELRIENWELQDPVTRRDRRSESATDYILVSGELEKQGCRIWRNEGVDFLDHRMTGYMWEN